MTEPVTVHTEAGVALLTLNRPDSRNALSGELVAAVAAAFDRLENDGRTTCVVLTGAGRAFCAGAELDTLQAAVDGEFDRVRTVYDGFLRVLNSPLATIAAINGPAVGAGLNLALACDLRLAAPRALFDTRFTQLRIHPGGGHVWMLARAVGQQQAILACLYGEVWSAQEALAKGLVASVHPAEELVQAALTLGHRLDGQSTEYTRRLVSTLRHTFEITRHADALEQETVDQQWSTTLPAFGAGVSELMERIRAPK